MLFHRNLGVSSTNMAVENICFLYKTLYKEKEKDRDKERQEMMHPPRGKRQNLILAVF